MSDNGREDDFERESSRLDEGLKCCRTVVNNYRAMLTGEPHADNDDSAMSDYVSTSSSTVGVYGQDAGGN